MQGGRNGRAKSGALIGASAVLALLVLAAVLVLQHFEAGGEGAPVAVPVPRDPAGRSHPVELEPSSAERSSGAANAPTGSRGASPGADAFDGRGVLRGEVVAARGSALPERWTLVVEPSPMLAGRERATSRRIEFERGERTFEVADLPLAGYRVSATARAMNSVPADVLLVASSPAAFVTLPFTASGFMEGHVQRADGTAAEGLAVTLERADTGARTRTECDVNGAWILRDVLDGEYRLYHGPPETPLVPARAIVFRAPSLRVPEVSLPEVAGFLFRVRDEVDTLIPGVAITGTSAAGSSFAVTTDANGEARARYLLPGTWRVEARVEAASGRASEERTSGRVTVELAPGPEQECALRIRP